MVTDIFDIGSSYRASNDSCEDTCTSSELNIDNYRLTHSKTNEQYSLDQLNISTDVETPVKQVREDTDIFEEISKSGQKSTRYQVQ